MMQSMWHCMVLECMFMSAHPSWACGRQPGMQARLLYLCTVLHISDLGVAGDGSSSGPAVDE